MNMRCRMVRATPASAASRAIERTYARSSLHRRWTPADQFTDRIGTPAGSRTRTIAAMPAPRWFFRFMYDRESAAWARRRNEPEHRELVERTTVSSRAWWPRLDLSPTSAAVLARTRWHSRGAVTTSWASTGRLAWSRSRGHQPRDEVGARFGVHDISGPLRFADAGLGGVLAILVLQHLPHPAALLAEIRRCLRPGGHLLITAPACDSTSRTSQNLHWRLHSVLPPRARRRPLLRHQLSPSSG